MQDGPFIERRRPRRRRRSERSPGSIATDAEYSSRWARWGPLAVPPAFLAFLIVVSAPWLIVGAMGVYVTTFAALSIVNDPWRLTLTGSTLEWRSWLRSGTVPVSGLTAIEWKRVRNGDMIALRFADGSSLGLGGSWSDFERSMVGPIRALVPGLEVRKVGQFTSIRLGYRRAVR